MGWLIGFIRPVAVLAAVESTGAMLSTCAARWPQIRLVAHPLCRLCGRPFFDASEDDHHCAACLARQPYFVRARAWGCYPRDERAEHPLRQVVQKFKYGRKVSLGKPLGRLMAQGCQEFLRECHVDLIIPVPLHPKRLRWRGFNQSLLLARQVSRLYEVPVDPFVLCRERETPPQTQLAEDERRKNVRGAFAIYPGKLLKGRRVLLVEMFTLLAQQPMNAAVSWSEAGRGRSTY